MDPRSAESWSTCSEVSEPRISASCSSASCRSWPRVALPSCVNQSSWLRRSAEPRLRSRSPRVSSESMRETTRLGADPIRSANTRWLVPGDRATKRNTPASLAVRPSSWTRSANRAEEKEPIWESRNAVRVGRFDRGGSGVSIPPYYTLDRIIQLENHSWHESVILDQQSNHARSEWSAGRYSRARHPRADGGQSHLRSGFQRGCRVRLAVLPD